MATSAPSFAEPTNRVENRQVDESETIAATMDVEAGETDSVVAAVTSQANSAVGFVNQATELDSVQVYEGAVSARSSVEAGSVVGSAVSSATAQGNALGVVAEDGLEMSAAQSAGPDSSVSALSELRLDSYAGATVQTAAAASNAIEVYGSGYMPMDIDQRSSATVNARVELDAANAEIETGVLASQAAGNAFNATGDESSIVAMIDQRNAGDITAESTAQVDAADHGLTVSAQAAGNTAATFTQWGYGHHQGQQANVGEVRAIARLDANDFGHGALVGSAVAYGNNSQLDTVGSDAYSAMYQVNTGAVTGEVLMQGGAGMALFGSSTAIGNTHSASICSDCPVELYAPSTQYNSGNVLANTQIRSPGAAHAIAGSATAVGNAMTFSTLPRN